MFSKLISGVSQAVRTVRDDRQKLVAARDEKQAKIDFLRSAPLCRAELQAKIDGAIDLWRDDFSDCLGAYLKFLAAPDNTAAGKAIGLLTPRSRDPNYAEFHPSQLNGLLAFMCFDDVRASMKRALDAMDWSKAGPPMAERGPEIERLRQEVAALDVQIRKLDADLRDALKASAA